MNPRDVGDGRVVHVPDRGLDDPFRPVVVGDPGRDLLVDEAVYDRGAAFLVALRRTVGEAHFAELLRRWATGNEDGNVTTADLLALAEDVSGQQLDGLFRDWPTDTDKPAV